MEQKTFTKSRDFEITIRGNYSVYHCLKEELEEISIDEVFDYLIENILDFCNIKNLKVSEQKIIEEE